MPVYQRQGKIPHKRHIVFRKPNGDLYHEELFGTEGFSGISSLLYHLYPPTMVDEIKETLREVCDEEILGVHMIYWEKVKQEIESL